MKNLFKSIFIAIFPMVAIYAFIASIAQLVQQGFSFLSLGNLLTSTAIIILFAGLFIKSQARTSRNLNSYTFFIALGFLISVISGFIEIRDLLSFSISFVLALSWVAYLKWYSVFEKRETSILKVGNMLPSFELEGSSKNKIPSTTFIGNPAIYLFYRGNWCTLCMAQIKEIASQYKELEKRGVVMNFISPQPHEFSNSLAKKYDLGFNFLTDADNKVAKQLRIFSENGIPAGFQAFGFDSDTVLPTVIITDEKGKIVFADLTDNYRVRPEPETFLRVLDGLKNN